MNIMVYDVAAESGGAMSILEYFYEIHKKNKKNHYYYILSTCQLNDTDNITVINVPNVKKGWIYRLWFDYIGVKKYLKKFEIDEILSLQNTIVPCFKGKQTVYEHNALPFVEYRFTLKEDKKLWVYQNVIGKIMLSGIKKADRVIVQTDWMKQSIIRRAPETEKKIEVCFPQINLLEGYIYRQTDRCCFFYPANAASFKNHKLILEACAQLKEKRVTDYTIIFTLRGNETDEIRSLYTKGQRENYDIRWVGTLSKTEVFKWYEKSVLLFPSYVETIGLPIYEAMSVGCPLLLANCQYAKNVANNYKNVQYFDYNDADMLAQYMMKKIVREMKM